MSLLVITSITVIAVDLFNLKVFVKVFTLYLDNLIIRCKLEKYVRKSF